MNKQNGYVLVVVLIFMTLFSTIAYIAYDIAHRETIIASKQEIKNKTNASSSSIINHIIVNANEGGEITNHILNATESGDLFCLTKNGLVKNSNSDNGCNEYIDDENRLSALAIIEKEECTNDYGYSNMDYKCFSIRSLGQYKNNSIKTGESQHIQSRAINGSSTGVYDL